MIRVVGLDYCIRLSSADMSQHLIGETSFGDCCIYIRSDLSLQKQQQTLWHEILHIVLDGEETGKVKVDEDFVTRVSNQLFAILADNKLLAKNWWDNVVDEKPLFLPSSIPAGAVVGRKFKTTHSTRKKK